MQKEGQIWYQEKKDSNKKAKECDEDMASWIWDLSSTSEQAAEDSQYSYLMQDMDKILDRLEIPVRELVFGLCPNLFWA